MYSLTATTGDAHRVCSSGLEGTARRDHLKLDALFEAARTAVLDDDLPLAMERFAAFRLGVLRHLYWEEHALFGPCARCGSRHAAADLPHHRGEHQALIAAMDEALQVLSAAGSAEDVQVELADRLDRLEILLGDHLDEEVERVMRPLDSGLAMPAAVQLAADLERR